MDNKLFLLCRSSLIAATLLFAFSVSLHAQKTWSVLSGDWTVDANWAPTPAPTAVEASNILFDSATVNNNAVRTVTLNIAGETQTLTGGLTFENGSTASRPFILELNDKRLILDGNTLGMQGQLGSSERDLGTFRNGVVQVGTAENATSIQLGRDFAEANPSPSSNVVYGYRLVFGEESVLDTVNTSDILVAASKTGGAARNRKYVLDLSQAELRSRDGEGNVVNNALKTTGSIRVGNMEENTIANATTYKNEGRILFGNVQSIDVGGDLILGRYQRSSAGNNTISYYSIGTLEFAAASYSQPVEVNVGGDLILGYGDRAIGEVEDAPALNLTVGSASQRSVIYVGYKNQSHGTSFTNGDTSGSLVTPGGTFDAHLTELVVGVNTQTRDGGSTTGVLNFSNSELGTLDISGDAIIGQGIRAQGELHLKGGAASSVNLTVGDATGSNRSLLSLSGTSWTVSNALSVGALGDISLNVMQGVINIDLTSDDPLNFTIASGGLINAIFDEAPAGSLWAIRQLGDQRAEFGAFLSDTRLTASGGYGNLADVYFDGTYTYYGIIPEPPAFPLVVAGVVALLLHYRRKTAWSIFNKK